MKSFARAIPRILSIFCFVSLILLPVPVIACNCSGTLSPCYEVGAGAAVFTRKVISVSPAFLNRLNGTSRADAGRITQFHDQLSSGVQVRNLQGMKESFLELVPGLPPASIRRVKEAKSAQALLRIFDSVLNQGSYVTLEVKTVFAKGGDDDDDKNTSGKNDDRAMDVKKDVKSARAKDAAKKGRARDDDDDRGKGTRAFSQ